jgi:hypothetical protein
MRFDYTTKLNLGLERLHAAADHPDLLGCALLSLHGALEDCVRIRLSEQGRMERQLRFDVLTYAIQWRDLLRLGEQYLELSPSESAQIRAVNQLRNRFAHGGTCRILRADVDAYAALVSAMINQRRNRLTLGGSSVRDAVDDASVVFVYVWDRDVLESYLDEGWQTVGTTPDELMVKLQWPARA